MTIPLTGAGSLFVKLGHIGGGTLDVFALEGGTATARVLSGALMTTRVATLETDYAAGTAEQQVLDGIYTTLSSYQSAQSGFLTALQTLAGNTLVDMANTDSPLAQKTVNAAMKILISQMKVASASVQASVPAAGAQTSVGTPTGNAIIVMSVKDGTGVAFQYAFPETLRFICTSDGQSNTTLAQNEIVTVSGQALGNNQLAYNWPFGSGTNLAISATDASKNNSGGNLLQNSDFVNFTTANNPDNWTLTVGAATTDWFNGGNGNAYYAGSTPAGGSVQITGTGGALLDAMTQAFNTTPVVTVGAGGTAGVLQADTSYALNCWVKCSATPAAGVLEFSLINAAGGATINDDQAVANLFTKSLTAVSTTYVNVNGVFRTPAVMPAGVKLKVRLSTAIDSGKSVFISRMALNKQTQLYAGGPYCSIFSGNINLINGIAPDTWTVAITNTYGVFQKLFEQWFSMRANGLSLPSAGSPTIADSLVA